MANSLLELLDLKKIIYSGVQSSESFLSFIISVSARPGTKREAIEVQADGSLKISLREKPVEGAANKAICEVLSQAFSVSKSQIELISGEKSKIKRFKISFLFTAHKNVLYYEEKIKKLLDEL